MPTPPRRRATAIVMCAGSILLARDEGRTAFALPGGGVHPNELPIAAVARELHEETTLTATSIKYLFTHSGKYNNHYVFAVEADGDVDISQDDMIAEFVWWDGSPSILVHPHVSAILNTLKTQT